MFIQLSEKYTKLHGPKIYLIMQYEDIYVIEKNAYLQILSPPSIPPSLTRIQVSLFILCYTMHIHLIFITGTLVLNTNLGCPSSTVKGSPNPSASCMLYYSQQPFDLGFANGLFTSTRDAHTWIWLIDAKCAILVTGLI